MKHTAENKSGNGVRGFRQRKPLDIEPDLYRSNSFHNLFSAMNEISHLSEEDQQKVVDWFEAPEDEPFPTLVGKITYFYIESPLPHIKKIEQECDHAWTLFKTKNPDLYEETARLVEVSHTFYTPYLDKYPDVIHKHNQEQSVQSQSELDEFQDTLDELVVLYNRPSNLALNKVLDIFTTEIADELQLTQPQRDRLFYLLVA